jgi:hypothetical protein
MGGSAYLKHIAARVRVGVRRDIGSEKRHFNPATMHCVQDGPRAPPHFVTGQWILLSAASTRREV